MVFGPLNMLAENVWVRLVAGIVLILTGINHIMSPGNALVADLLNWVAEFIGLASGSGLIVSISFLVGVGVSVIGLGVIGRSLSELDVY